MDKTKKERSGMNFLIKMNPRHRKSFKSLSGMPNMTEHGISGPLNPVSVEAKVENKSRSSEDTEEDFGLRRIARSWTSDDPSYLRNRVALSITEMKMKYSRNVSASKVPVKEKVALMESWSRTAGAPKPKVPARRSTSSNSGTEKPSSYSPSKVQFRDQQTPAAESKPVAQHPPLKPRRSAREAKHRRSMSDPNLQKSFQAMKKLWDKKVQQQSDTSATARKPNWSPKSRGNSLSSTHSVDNDIIAKQSKDPPHTTLNKGNNIKEKRTGPPTPTKPKPKPKPSPLRLTEEYPRDLKKKPNSFTTQPPPTTPTSVKNRARMFDVPGDNNASKDFSPTSLNRSKNRSSTEDGGSYKPNKKHDSPRRLVNNNENKPGKENSKLESVRLLDYDETETIRNDNDDSLMRSIRRNSANSAKERRKVTRRGSSHSDSDSSCSATSSLSSTSVEGPVVLRRHACRDENSPVKQQPKPIVKSYLHRNASPTTSRPDSPVQAITPKPSPRSGSIGSRSNRSGSLGNIATPPAISPQTSSRRQSSLHRDHSSSSVNDDVESPTAALNRKLSIDAAKRVSGSTDSGTGTNRNSSTSEKYYGGNLDSIMSGVDNFKRGGSFSSLASLNKTPPPPPPSRDKPTRGRSSSSAAIMPNIVVRPSVPPPPPPINHKRSKSGSIIDKKEIDSDMGSTTTISSRMSLLSGIGDGTFNAEEEYNRILNVIATPTSTKRLKNSTSSSQADMDDSSSISTEQDESSSGNRDSLEVPSRKSRASDNDSYSDFETSDVDEDESRISLNVSTDQQNPAESTPAKVPLEVKLHNIAKELLSTEATYVDVLNLIDQIFHKRVLDAISKKQIPSDVKNIFSNVSAIYQFHSGFLLPQLKARLDSWEENPKIGDILTQAAPFLKMYSLYVQNFHEAMTVIKHWSEKSHNFANIIKQTQAMEECGNLSLEHHMLGPVQRIPRYKMLLEDYLKRLPEDSPDRLETSTALDLISKAADHTNESMRQNDKFNRMLSIYNNLVDINFDIVVSRELIMEGKIIKISARNGEKHERYLYLFNDMLLCCTPLRRLQKKSYKITAKIDLEGMEIKAVTNMNIPNTFCVNGTNKSMEFAANSPEEKEKWVNAVNDAIDAYLERKTSFMKSGSQRVKSAGAVEDVTPDSPLHLSDSYSQLNSPLRTPTHKAISFEEFDTAGADEKRIEISCNPGTGSTYVVDIEDHDLGKRAPRWIKDNEVTMCMHCSKAFNRLLRRRHHCRACGRVICTECSEHKLELPYETGKSLKVCNKCHAILTGRKGTDGGDKKSVLQIEADVVSEGSVISEYLYFSEADKRKAWTKMWCVIPRNEPCLYVYGANQDVRAAMTMPLLGFSIVEDNTIDRDFAFKLVQARKTLCFAASSVEQKNRWKYVFQRVTLGAEVLREDVYNSEKVDAELLLEPASRASLHLTGLSLNGSSRLSSSSGESSNLSAYTPSDSSSRPTSIMGTNAHVYESMEDQNQEKEKFDEETFQTNNSS